MLHTTHKSASLARGEHEAAGYILGTEQTIAHLSRHVVASFSRLDSPASFESMAICRASKGHQFARCKLGSALD